MSDEDIADYVHLCQIIGGCTDLIQAGGGNISIKSNEQLIIKKSGYFLGETTSTKGYVLCNLTAIKEAFYKTNEDLTLTIQGGDLPGQPSIETFFHILPKKYILHLHPTKLLSYLCGTNWESDILHLNVESSLNIRYKKPGLELAKEIIAQYKDENILFLQNHGVIVCDNTIDSVLKRLATLLYCLDKYSPVYPSSDILLCHQAHSYICSHSLASSIFIKRGPNLETFQEKRFAAISPDIFLFLKKSPLLLTSNDDFEERLTTYIQNEKCLPKVIYSNNIFYAVGTSYKECVAILEILESYLQILKNQKNLITLTLEQQEELLSWKKENYRIQSLQNQ
jgi:rhamnose utilization protein RhaD (predicted bifunctional aldolase and dehydrogenase)